MKQHISAEDLQELTQEQKERLREWWKVEIGDMYVDEDGDIDSVYFSGLEFVHGVPGYTKGHDTPLLSIGQMIELLESKDECLNITKKMDFEGWGYEIWLRHIKYWEFTYGELCDALFAAIKEML